MKLNIIKIGSEYQVGSFLITSAHIAEMREWVADCQWGDDVAGLSDEAIIRGVNRHFDGGLESFMMSVAQ